MLGTVWVGENGVSRRRFLGKDVVLMGDVGSGVECCAVWV